jgi:ABC-2 type transport system ATP-binding protein
MKSPAIEVRDLIKTFQSDHGQVVRAVDQVSFVVPEGATVGLLGGNGAGKTTTIAMILGLIEPTGGAIRVFGHDIARERNRVLKLMNFQSPYVDLPRRLTVRQNLMVYANLYGVRNPKGRIAQLAQDLDFATLMDRPFGQLSAGQRTRIGLAKALINCPRLLLLDEPTASLDPDTADWVRSYLERYKAEENATIFLASHNMGEVERLCSDVLMMREAKIVDKGSPAALLTRYGRDDLEEVFLDIARKRGKIQAGVQTGAVAE